MAGAPQQPTLIVGVAYKGLSRDERNEWIEEGAIRVMNDQAVSKAVVIGIDVIKKTSPYPYDVLSVVMKSENARQESY
jgi:hypothetical protein